MCAPSLCQDEQLDTHCTELNLSQLSDKLEKIQQAHSWRTLLSSIFMRNLKKKYHRRNNTKQAPHLTKEKNGH